MRNLLKQNNLYWIGMAFCLSITIAIFTITSCKKDPPVYSPAPGVHLVNDADSCYVITGSPPPSGWNYQTPPLSYGWPDFNPNNKNEFVYIESDDTGARAGLYQRLCTYNMQTGQKKLLVTDNFSLQPKWGSSGWIVYTSWPDYQLWIIKFDGSGLKQITNDPAGSSHLYPEWSPDGSKLIFIYGDQIKASTRIIDLNGNIIKGNVKIGPPFSWALDGTHIAGGSGILDTGTNTVVIYPYYVNRLFPDQKSWITTDTTGIYVYHTASNTRQLIKESCKSRSYDFYSISKDGKKILADRTINKKINKKTLLRATSVVMMDADGTNVQVVDIK
jgi:Tol biopolymer transport system component